MVTRPEALARQPAATAPEDGTMLNTASCCAIALRLARASMKAVANTILHFRISNLLVSLRVKKWEWWMACGGPLCMSWNLVTVVATSTEPACPPELRDRLFCTGNCRSHPVWFESETLLP